MFRLGRSPIERTMKLSTATTLALQTVVDGFSYIPSVARRQFRLFASESNTLPSLEQYSTDPFIKQVSYAEPLVSLLYENDQQGVAKPLLEAQLSHSDGIRGFFVTYLTAEPQDGSGVAADQEDIPQALQNALGSVKDATDLVSLACMNLIMPTAMTTMHTDPDQQESSRLTASRGKRVLQHLDTVHELKVKAYCTAILGAASDESGEPDADLELVNYWKSFFEKWGYKEKQLHDIVAAVKDVLLN